MNGAPSRRALLFAAPAIVAATSLDGLSVLRAATFSATAHDRVMAIYINDRLVRIGLPRWPGSGTLVYEWGPKIDVTREDVLRGALFTRGLIPHVRPPWVGMSPMAIGKPMSIGSVAVRAST